MEDEAFLKSKGWRKEDTRDVRCWRLRESGFGLYDTRAALKIQMIIDREKAEANAR